jgi:hypothetical protein
MALSPEEFAHTLPTAMRDWPVTGGPSSWRVDDPSGRRIATIHTEPLADRRLGVLSLPVLAVEIELVDAPPDRVTEFLRRFDCGFHRGGG